MGFTTVAVADGLGRTVAEILSLYEDGEKVTRTYRTGYNALGLVGSITLPDNTGRQWSYDSLGPTTRVEDPNAGTHRRSFDDLGQVLAGHNATGDTVSFGYDPAGRLHARHKREWDSPAKPITWALAGSCSSRRRRQAPR